ncbi:hypothetical protein IF623_003309 [Salmonella enterica]|nr:hypothetical protein [Salmonella enterica]
MELNQSTLPQYLKVLADKGVVFEKTPSYLSMKGVVGDSAVDMATVANGGIPAAAAQVIDPMIIKQLFAPTVATQIYPEVKKGTWAVQDVLFPRTEEAYEIVAYDDRSRAGSTHVNANWEQRRQMRFQGMNEWGDLEQEKYGMALIPYVAMKQAAGVDAINRFFNKSYMYGISGAPNFGIMNDPALPAALTPITTADGKVKWADKDAVGIFNDVKKMFTNLAAKNQGLVQETSPMKLVVSPSDNASLGAINALGTASAIDLIKKTYTSLTVVVVPEFGTPSGGLIQLIAESLGGNPVGNTVYTEKMRAFPVFVEHSMTSQKLAAGTLGTVIYRPSGVVQMTGTL